MIGLNWKKSLVVAGAALAVAAAIPAMSQAHTQYTGVTPPTVVMAPGTVFEKPMKASTVKKISLHKKSKHKGKKHKKTAAKKHTA